jgi:hypothetical protein
MTTEDQQKTATPAAPPPPQAHITQPALTLTDHEVMQLRTLLNTPAATITPLATNVQ